MRLSPGSTNIPAPRMIWQNPGYGPVWISKCPPRLISTICKLTFGCSTEANHTPSSDKSSSVVSGSSTGECRSKPVDPSLSLVKTVMSIVVSLQCVRHGQSQVTSRTAEFGRPEVTWRRSKSERAGIVLRDDLKLREIHSVVLLDGLLSEVTRRKRLPHVALDLAV